MSSQRQDIQVLRGIAVLGVIAFHAEPALIRGGFLGVDVFFVISGYLVTRMLIDAGERGGWTAFLVRRAKRLLPATYCTLFFTSLLALLILSPSQAQSYAKQLAGALTFSENIVLWRETGYFDGPAQFKPLLHVWSLSLEEQFYFLVPLVFLFTPRRWWLGLLAFACAASLLLCCLLVEAKTIATFYLLPTRAWQLLAGATLTVLESRRRLEVPPALRLAAGIALLGPLLLPIDWLHPRGDAILVTVATVLLLAGGFERLAAHRRLVPLQRVGDWSYSLYLVHWPLLAFAANLYAGEPAWYTRLGCVALCFPLGYLQYRFVEQRFRHVSMPTRRVFGAALAVPVAMMAVFLPLAPSTSDAPAVNFRQPNWGFGQECDYVSQPFVPKAACGNVVDPRVAVWGDSFAMHYVPGLRESVLGGSLIQITRSACPPVLADRLAHDGPVAEACLRFNQAALHYLERTPSITYVVVASTFVYPFQPEMPSDQFAAALAGTLEKLRAAGKKIVVLAPPPRARYDVGECLEREHAGQPALSHTGCDIRPADLDEAYRSATKMLRGLEQQGRAAVLYPSDALCAEVCRSVLNGVYLYRDEGHLSRAGSVAFAARFDLANKIMRAAR